MDFDLVVSVPFGGYLVGTRITDPAVVAEILTSEAVGFVVRVSKTSEGGNESSLPDPVLQAGDELIMRRATTPRLVEVTDFETFLTAPGRAIAQAIAAGGGGGSSEPAGLSRLAASLISA